MSDAHASSGPSAGMAVVAAFLWATYFFFVLALTPGTAPSAVFAYPFLIAGVVYVAWAAFWGHGRAVAELFLDPRAWVRILFLMTMQLSVLACTYAAGAVDTSLLALLGDAAVTPLVAMAILREGRHRARSPAFVGGLLLAIAGASLTIVASGRAAPFRGWTVLIAPLVPLSIAAFYILSAREGQRRPSSAVVGEATLAAGFVGLAIAGLLPGGWHGLALTSATQVVLLAGVAVTSFFIAPALYFRAVARSGIVLPGLFQVLIPVFALSLSIVLLHYLPAPLGLVGIPVAVTGGLLAFRGAQAPAPPTSRDEAMLTEGGTLAPDAPDDPTDPGSSGVK